MNQLTTTPSPAPTAVPCPRCKQPLVDPKGLGWCKACGYCQSLAEGAATTTKAPDPSPTPTPQNTVTATGAALAQTPGWFVVAALGVILVAGGTFACAHYLTFTPLQRALFTTIAIVGGFGLMFLGQFIGLMRIAP